MLQRFSKVKKNRSGKTTGGGIISSTVKDHGDEPFFVKKADAAKAVIDKYGFPKELALKK